MIALTKQVLLKGNVSSNPTLFLSTRFCSEFRLFYGKIRQRITSVEVFRSSIHEKEDLFSHLPVNVANDGIDIYDGLSGYFDDVVEFQGRKAKMEVTLVDLPPLLQIQLQVGNSILFSVYYTQSSLLQRVQFNRETLQPYKSQAYVKFGENLYMDRFMDDADPNKKAQSKGIQAELNACRERMRLLVEGKVNHKGAFVVISYLLNWSGIPIYNLLGTHQILLGGIAKCIHTRNRR